MLRLPSNAPAAVITINVSSRIDTAGFLLERGAGLERGRHSFLPGDLAADRNVCPQFANLAESPCRSKEMFPTCRFSDKPGKQFWQIRLCRAVDKGRKIVLGWMLRLRRQSRPWQGMSLNSLE